MALDKTYKSTRGERTVSSARVTNAYAHADKQSQKHARMLDDIALLMVFGAQGDVCAMSLVREQLSIGLEMTRPTGSLQSEIHRQPSKDARRPGKQPANSRPGSHSMYKQDTIAMHACEPAARVYSNTTAALLL